MKNSRQPIVVGKGTKKRVIYRKNDEVVRVMQELANLAREARAAAWEDKMLPDRTPFACVIVLFHPNYISPDADGSANTILDALQGVLYSNDRYCVRLELTKEIDSRFSPSAVITVGSLEAYNDDKYRIY